jgi:hypothetical protein
LDAAEDSSVPLPPSARTRVTRVVAVDAATKDRKDILLGVSSRSICETKLDEALMDKREIDPTLLAIVDTLAG